jgi:hypothetical protein
VPIPTTLPYIQKAKYYKKIKLFVNNNKKDTYIDKITNIVIAMTTMLNSFVVDSNNGNGTKHIN